MGICIISTPFRRDKGQRGPKRHRRHVVSIKADNILLPVGTGQPESKRALQSQIHPDPAGCASKPEKAGPDDGATFRIAAQS